MIFQPVSSKPIIYQVSMETASFITTVYWKQSFLKMRWQITLSTRQRCQVLSWLSFLSASLCHVGAVLWQDEVTIHFTLGSLIHVISIFDQFRPRVVVWLKWYICGSLTVHLCSFTLMCVKVYLFMLFSKT